MDPQEGWYAMPGRRGTETRKLSGSPLTVRFTPEVRSAIDIAADTIGVTAAAWIREITVHELGAPLDHIVPVTQYRPPSPRPSQAILDLVDLRHLVRETNGNLTRLAVSTRQLGYEDLRSEIEASLDAISAAVKQIDRFKLLLLREERGRLAS
jgi:hypothetical protein